MLRRVLAIGGLVVGTAQTCHENTDCGDVLIALPRDETTEGLQLLQLHQEQNRSATYSPYWCSYISSTFQMLVPPCWFGTPDPEPDDVGAGYPSWCKHVPESMRFMVGPCDNESSITSITRTTTVGSSGSSGLVIPELQEVSHESKYKSPYWCGYIEHLVQYLVPPCWFGTPEAEPPDVPAGFPSWCKHVPESVRGMVSQCPNVTSSIGG